MSDDPITPAATTELWRQVHDRLRAFIAKRVADPAAADDVLQDVFLRVHRGIGEVKDPERMVSWLYQVARHAVVDWYRSPARRRERPAGSPAEVEETAALRAIEERDTDGSELTACLRPMLERLSQDYREAVTLVELDGLSQQAAADRLGLSLSGMKSRVQRGRKQLKRLLDDCCLIELDRRGGVVDYEPREAGCDPCRNTTGARTVVPPKRTL